MKRLLAGAAAIAVIAAVYLLRIDDVGGLYKDDAYYMVLARSLASGQGYALISSSTPILPAFPPGFPLLLAPVMALTPNYPDNLVWLKIVSIAAMAATALLTWLYFARYRAMASGQAAVIALLTALTPGFVFLATSTVMSECVFAFALMGSVIAIDHAARQQDQRSRRRAIVLAAIAATAACLIRGAGAPLVGAGAVFLTWKHGWRTAAGFLIACAICYAPWAGYAASRSPTATERAAYGGDSVRAYRSPLSIGVGPLAARAADNAVNIFGRDIGAMILPAVYRGADESGLEVFVLTGARGLDSGSMGIGAPSVVVSGLVAMVVIFGAITLARRREGVAELVCVLTIGMLALFTKEAIYRYMLPLAPFVIGYFVIGVQSVATRFGAAAGAATFRIAGASLLALLIAEHASYIWLTRHGPLPPWIRDGREVRSVTDFVNQHLPADAQAASTNPGLVFLATGRKAAVYIDPDERWSHWKATGVRYVVALHAVPQPGSTLGYAVIYESPRLGLWVLDMAPGQP